MSAGRLLGQWSLESRGGARQLATRAPSGRGAAQQAGGRACSSPGASPRNRRSATHWRAHPQPLDTTSRAPHALQEALNSSRFEGLCCGRLGAPWRAAWLQDQPPASWRPAPRCCTRPAAAAAGHRQQRRRQQSRALLRQEDPGTWRLRRCWGWRAAPQWHMPTAGCCRRPTRKRCGACIAGGAPPSPSHRGARGGGREYCCLPGRAALPPPPCRASRSCPWSSGAASFSSTKSACASCRRPKRCAAEAGGRPPLRGAACHLPASHQLTPHFNPQLTAGLRVLCQPARRQELCHDARRHDALRRARLPARGLQRRARGQPAGRALAARERRGGERGGGGEGTETRDERRGWRREPSWWRRECH